MQDTSLYVAYFSDTWKLQQKENEANSILIHFMSFFMSSRPNGATHNMCINLVNMKNNYKISFINANNFSTRNRI